MARRFADLVIGGDIDFPDLPGASGTPVMTIDRGRVPRDAGDLLQQWLTDSGETWLSIARVEDGYRVSVSGLTCLISSSGSDVRVDAAASMEQPEIDHLLLHQVLPLALSRTGRVVLHACAVETAAGAIAFVGQSGSGKSTLAAAFCRRGHALVADDALAVDMSGEPIAVWPTADGLRLWDHMRAAAPAGAPLHATGTGKLRAPAVIARGRLPLARIYLLDTPDDSSSTIRPVPAAEVRLELLSHVFRLDVADRAESQRLFDAAHRTAASVPSRSIFYPNGLAYLDATVDAVLSDLAIASNAT